MGAADDNRCRMLIQIRDRHSKPIFPAYSRNSLTPAIRLAHFHPRNFEQVTV